MSIGVGVLGVEEYSRSRERQVLAILTRLSLEIKTGAQKSALSSRKNCRKHFNFTSAESEELAMHYYLDGREIDDREGYEQYMTLCLVL